MTDLTKAEIIEINYNQVLLFGGNFVPPDNFFHEENLDYLLEAVQADMFCQPLYPEIYQKAGLYMFNIVCNHLFQDGNKRTGLQAALIFLLLNEYRFAELVDDDLLTQCLTMHQVSILSRVYWSGSKPIFSRCNNDLCPVKERSFP